MLAEIEKQFRALAPAVEFCSLRLVHERHEVLSVRRDVARPVRQTEDLGVMVSVFHEGGLGYAATPDLSRAGLKQALEQARVWAEASAGHNLLGLTALERQPPAGEHHGPELRPWRSLSLTERLELLVRECARLKVDSRIQDWQASLWYTDTETLYLDSGGGRVYQRYPALLPSLSATAHRPGETQTRSFGRGAHVRRGGLEVLDATGFFEAAPTIGRQAVELLEAPHCPSGTMDLVLAPDQMILQIHESIGHPLELDRILGDERNYAGASFVTPEMFGRYPYGSELLNVTFDPSHPEQIASYAYDDEGRPAAREYLIQNGVLLRPLGGGGSQARTGLPGVANARACAWNRPPIDRMANLNLEPGSDCFADLLARVERGVYMETNCSWSIDDSRNKFQFGCEWGRLIKDGELTCVIKNPNYRGISASFWRSLAGVGDASTWQVLGVANCGKGEPNQAIRVGHASPPCLFRQVAVFGGE